MGEWELPESPTLVRVIPLARDLGLVDGMRSVVTSLEIWRDSFVVHRLTIPPPDLSDPGKDPLWDVEDDVGTVYRAKGMNGGGDQTVFRETRRWSPAPPVRASMLRLGVPGTGAAGRALVEVSLEDGVETSHG